MIRIYNHARVDVTDHFGMTWYPAGEPRVSIACKGGGPFLIDCRFQGVSDFMMMLAVSRAIKRMGEKASLFIPYFPGARADRPERGGEFGLKFFADLVNREEFEKVVVVDPHSTGVIALVERCKVVSLQDTRVIEYVKGCKAIGLIAPDYGAAKKVEELGHLMKLPVAYASKRRDPLTGKLDQFSIHGYDHAFIRPGDWVVVDDICDGGGTFKGLRYILPCMGSGLYWGTRRYHLWTTHGIYSKGTKDLLGLFASLGCTDSVRGWDYLPNQTEGPLKMFKLDTIALSQW